MPAALRDSPAGARPKTIFAVDMDIGLEVC
jgi:hypothetical protein